LEALVMALPMVLPSVIAVSAIAPPTIARISAYSAAEAPESSRSMLMNVFIFPIPSLKCPHPFPGARAHSLRVDREKGTQTPLATCRWNRVVRQVAGAPERSAAEGLLVR